MKINPNPIIRCGGYDICKARDYFPCTDCFHKIIEKGDIDIDGSIRRWNERELLVIER